MKLRVHKLRAQMDLLFHFTMVITISRISKTLVIVITTPTSIKPFSNTVSFETKVIPMVRLSGRCLIFNTCTWNTFVLDNFTGFLIDHTCKIKIKLKQNKILISNSIIMKI